MIDNLKKIDGKKYLFVYNIIKPSNHKLMAGGRRARAVREQEAAARRRAQAQVWMEAERAEKDAQRAERDARRQARREERRILWSDLQAGLFVAMKAFDASGDHAQYLDVYHATLRACATSGVWLPRDLFRSASLVASSW